MSDSIKARGRDVSMLYFVYRFFFKVSDSTQIQGEMTDYGGVIEVTSSIVSWKGSTRLEVRERVFVKHV